MAKKNANAKPAAPPQAEASSFGTKQWLAIGAMVLMLSAAATIFLRGNVSNTTAVNQPVATPTQAAVAAPIEAPPAPNLSDTPFQMTIAQAVMVTEEIDFGQPVPSIAQALQQIERSYVPDDGKGRTFAILDAYGEPTADGKLHISMHVSSEKSGMAFLRNKRTGKLIWQARIGKPGDAPAGPKNLMIYVSNGQGGNYVLDGGRGMGNSVLDIYIKDSQQKLRDVWPSGEAREFTFIYSACGCPVKVIVERQGETVRRTKELPVIFPDDPDAVRTIAGIMKW